MPALSNSRRKRSRCRESGYVLLTLVLMMALISIFAMTLVTDIKFDIRREREGEMIHRGVQYSRAIRGYYKKFGRYPTKIEDLESANNLRFLRKRYKDPVTGQDFKLLHFGEVKLTFTGGIGGAPIAGASTLNGTGTLTGTATTQQGSPFGSNNAFGSNPANPNSPYGQNAQGANPQAASDPSQTNGSQANPSQPNSSQTGGAGQSDASSKPPDKDQQSGPTFGGGPIVGVASLSKKDTIREFNHKKKYNEWQFIYDPGTDRGGLLMTPNQPQLQGLQQNAPNVNGQPNSNLGNGQPPPGMQNNPNLPPNGNLGTPEPPNNPPPQQQ